jgi:two-component system chemotaxis response regulator CheY
MKKIIIVEDDMVSRKFLNKVLREYGDCDLVVDGLEAIDAFLISLKENSPYDLICLDIMMPKIDGVKVLKAMRDLENEKNISKENKSKIIMTTALGESDIVKTAFEYGCDASASKPIDLDKFREVLGKLGIIE